MSSDRCPCVDEWLSLVPGKRLTIVKLAPDGREAARYRGEVVAIVSPGAWVIFRASWNTGKIELDGLEFCPGDVLLEWFSPELPFNAFAVFSPAGSFRGWYANVTRPPYLLPSTDGDGDPPILAWHDMYLDLVGLPSGQYVIRDEHELSAASLGRDDPELYATVVAAGEALRRRFAGQALPFVAPLEMSAFVGTPKKSLPCT